MKKYNNTNKKLLFLILSFTILFLINSFTSCSCGNEVTPKSSAASTSNHYIIYFEDSDFNGYTKLNRLVNYKYYTLNDVAHYYFTNTITTNDDYALNSNTFQTVNTNFLTKYHSNHYKLISDNNITGFSKYIEEIIQTNSNIITEFSLHIDNTSLDGITGYNNQIYMPDDDDDDIVYIYSSTEVVYQSNFSLYASNNAPYGITTYNNQFLCC